MDTSKLSETVAAEASSVDSSSAMDVDSDHTVVEQNAESEEAGGQEDAAATSSSAQGDHGKQYHSVADAGEQDSTEHPPGAPNNEGKAELQTPADAEEGTEHEGTETAPEDAAPQSINALPTLPPAQAAEPTGPAPTSSQIDRSSHTGAEDTAESSLLPDAPAEEKATEETAGSDVTQMPAVTAEEEPPIHKKRRKINKRKRGAASTMRTRTTGRKRRISSLELDRLQFGIGASATRRRLSSQIDFAGRLQVHILQKRHVPIRLSI